MLELLYDMYGAEDQILSLTLAQILKRAIRETWETLEKKAIFVQQQAYWSTEKWTNQLVIELITSLITGCK